MHKPASANLNTPLRLPGTAVGIVACVILSLGGCASQQKVDRVHSSLYYQQASIQQLQHDIDAIERQRQEVISSLDQLRQESDKHSGLIRQNQSQLQQLDGAQQQLTRNLGAVRSSVAASRSAIASINSIEAQRQAIIRAQQEKWREITERTDRQLADIDQAKMGNALESTENTLENGPP